MGGYAYIAELAQAKLTERGDDFTPDFVGDVELHHAHLRRAERSVLLRSHGDGFLGRRELVSRVSVLFGSSKLGPSI